MRYLFRKIRPNGVDKFEFAKAIAEENRTGPEDMGFDISKLALDGKSLEQKNFWKLALMSHAQRKKFQSQNSLDSTDEENSRKKAKLQPKRSSRHKANGEFKFATEVRANVKSMEKSSQMSITQTGNRSKKGGFLQSQSEASSSAIIAQNPGASSQAHQVDHVETYKKRLRQMFKGSSLIDRLID